ETYRYLTEKLNNLGIVYIHLIDTAAPDGTEATIALIQAIRDKFSNTLILSNKYTAERAEKDLQNGLANLIAFGSPFIANPDLVERLRTRSELSPLDPSTLYAGGENGYV